MCKWIFDHPDFIAWRDNNDSQLLWIKGDAGKGKTMLLAGIINDEMLPQKKQSDEPDCQPVVMTYFFCQRNNKRINKATAVLRGLIYLLVEQQERLMKHWNDSYNLALPDTAEDVNAVFALSFILENMLRDIGATVYLIIDALDECDTAGLEEFLGEILRIAQLDNVRWLVSSRDTSLISAKLGLKDGNGRFQLELNAENILPAVNAYIDVKLLDFEWLKHNTALRDQVQVKIREKANATFLWVYFVCLWVSLHCEELEDAYRTGVLYVWDNAPSQLHHMENLTLLKLGYHKYKLFKKDHCKDYQLLELAITKYKEAISAARSSRPTYNTGIIRAYISLAECHRELSHGHKLSLSEKLDKVRTAEEYANKAQNLLDEGTPDVALLQRVKLEKAVLRARRVLVEKRQLKAGAAAETLRARNELSALKKEYEKFGNQTSASWADYWLKKLDTENRESTVESS